MVPAVLAWRVLFNSPDLFEYYVNREVFYDVTIWLPHLLRVRLVGPSALEVAAACGLARLRCGITCRVMRCA